MRIVRIVLASVMPVLALVAALGLMVPVAATAGTAASGKGDRTVVHTVDPVTANGLAAGYRIVRTVKGDCWAGSNTVAGAQRCLHGNEIMDPCWVYPRSSHRVVVCPTSPWSKQLIRIRSKERFSHYAAAKPKPQWPLGLKLANGWHCTIGDGARDEVHGQTVNWPCGYTRSGHYHVQGGVAGKLDRGHAVWTGHLVIWHAHADRYTSGGQVDVAQAWYAHA
jgi:hypothetical protein